MDTVERWMVVSGELVCVREARDVEVRRDDHGRFVRVPLTRESEVLRDSTGRFVRLER